MLADILDESWTLYTRHFVRFFLIALVVFGVINVVYASARELIGVGPATEELTNAIALVLTLVGGLWLSAALVQAVIDARDDAPVGAAGQGVLTALAETRPFIWPLLVTSLLAALGIVGGLLLLIVPGVILAVRWSLVAQIVVLEHQGGVAALKRSNALVRGSTGPLLLLVVIVTFVGAVAGLLLQGAFTAFPTFVQIAAGQTLASAVVQPFSAVALTLVYLRFVRLREPAASTPAPGDSWA